MRAKPPVQGAHHLLKFIYLQAKMQDMSARQLCEKAGVSYNTYKDAKNCNSNISLLSVEALLNTLGFTMKATHFENKNRV